MNPVSYKPLKVIPPKSSDKILGTSTTTKNVLNGTKVKKLTECTKEDLMKAKGVGEKTASLILENILLKKVNTVEDLDTIKGIGPKTIDELKKYCY